MVFVVTGPASVSIVNGDAQRGGGRRRGADVGVLERALEVTPGAHGER